MSEMSDKDPKTGPPAEASISPSLEGQQLEVAPNQNCQACGGVNDQVLRDRGICSKCFSSDQTLGKIYLHVNAEEPLSLEEEANWQTIKGLALDFFVGLNANDKAILKRIWLWLSSLSDRRYEYVPKWPMPENTHDWIHRLSLTKIPDMLRRKKDIGRKTDRSISESIEIVESKTPGLDIKSIEWIAAREKNSEELGMTIKTLREYRSPNKGGRRNYERNFGIDRDGRIWRRNGNSGSMVFYFAPSLPKKRLQKH